MDRSRASGHSADMPAIELKKSVHPAKKEGPRTNYSIRLSELEPGKWIANLQPEGRGRPGATMGGATPKEALAAMSEFLFE